MNFIIKNILFLIVLTIFTTKIYPQAGKGNITTRILFIFDMSNSMNAMWEKDKKIVVAKALMMELLDSLKQINNLQVALRMYGHQYPVPPQVCSDTRLEVPFSKDNIETIREVITKNQPKGTTPIARSLERCANDFPPCANCRNVVILITDGIEECDGDPCAIALALQSKKIIVKPYVIGIGMAPTVIDAFKCIGKYFNASTEKDFREIIFTVVHQAINPTTCQINLNDIHGNPTETNVNMTLYDANTGEMCDNLMHTLNYAKQPDTLYLDSEITYRIEVHTIPKVTIPKANIYPGRHTVIPTDAPQGTLQICETNSNRLKDVEFIVRQHKTCETLNIQKMEKTEKYIVGKYDIEVLTLPRKYFLGVEINQSQTTKLSIPQPGIATIILPAKGYASLYQIIAGKMVLLKNLNQITTESLTLLPGQYSVVYRSSNMYSTYATIVKNFEIKPGISELIKMEKFE